MSKPATSQRVLRLCLLLALVLVGCGGRSPIPLGFSGELTGIHSDLGVQGRNGVQLAVETVNAAGGVVGRPLELRVRDDLGTPEGARAADRALIEAGVVAIIGHMTSAQTLAALPLTEAAGVVLVSPTTSTYALSGQQDLFFRLISSNAQEARTLARYIHAVHGAPPVALIYDEDNYAFTWTFWEAFSETYRGLGGETGDTVAYSASARPNFGPLVADLLDGEPGGVLVAASAVDTAMIAQQIRRVDVETDLFATGWANTDALLKNGGRAVEGLKIVVPFDETGGSPQQRAFQQRYRDRFGREPNFAAAFAYDAVLVLAAALEETGGRAEALPEALAGIEGVEGAIGEIALDAYGDAIRPHFLVKIVDGRFVTLERLPPEGQ